MIKRFIFFLLVISSCQSREKFDKAKWLQIAADSITFPNRKYIINDLVKNYQIKGKSYKEIIELLGIPQVGEYNLDGSHDVFYTVDIDTKALYVKELYLKIKDSTIQDFKVQERDK